MLRVQRESFLQKKKNIYIYKKVAYHRVIDIPVYSDRTGQYIIGLLVAGVMPRKFYAIVNDVYTMTSKNHRKYRRIGGSKLKIKFSSVLI